MSIFPVELLKKEPCNFFSGRSGIHIIFNAIIVLTSLMTQGIRQFNAIIVLLVGVSRELIGVNNGSPQLPSWSLDSNNIRNYSMH